MSTFQTAFDFKVWRMHFGILIDSEDKVPPFRFRCPIHAGCRANKTVQPLALLCEIVDTEHLKTNFAGEIT
jgi:hypothetical protein